MGLHGYNIQGYSCVCIGMQGYTEVYMAKKGYMHIKLCSLLEGIDCSDCLQQKGPNHYRRVYHEGGNPIIPTCVTSNHHLIYSLNLH